MGRREKRKNRIRAKGGTLTRKSSPHSFARQRRKKREASLAGEAPFPRKKKGGKNTCRPLPLGRWRMRGERNGRKTTLNCEKTGNMWVKKKVKLRKREGGKGRARLAWIRKGTIVHFSKEETGLRSFLKEVLRKEKRGEVGHGRTFVEVRIFGEKDLSRISDRKKKRKRRKYRSFQGRRPRNKKDLKVHFPKKKFRGKERGKLTFRPRKKKKTELGVEDIPFDETIRKNKEIEISRKGGGGKGAASPPKKKKRKDKSPQGQRPQGGSGSTLKTAGKEVEKKRKREGGGGRSAPRIGGKLWL